MSRLRSVLWTGQFVREVRKTASPSASIVQNRFMPPRAVSTQKPRLA